MSKKNDESVDFSALFKDAKPVNHNQYVMSQEERELKRRSMTSAISAKKSASTHGPSNILDAGQLSSNEYAQDAASIALSDTYEAHWPDGKPIKYFNNEHMPSSHEECFSFRPKDMLKKLSMGHFPPEIELDLHGLTAKQAKAELVAVIFEAKKRHYACIGILHGHGNGTLKRKLPNWLVQHPDVAGFVQAPREYGGKAGLLVLISIDFQLYKPEFL